MSERHATREARHGSLSQASFAQLRDLLAAYGGIFLDDGQQRMLEVAVAQRAEALESEHAAYLEGVLARREPAELQRLVELVLNHETFFFRNRPHLQALQSTLLPEIHRRKPAGLPIRIWSAGCASGEEAYSIAIVALEALGRATGRSVEVIATDLSEPALRRAELGRYRGRTLQNVSPDLLARYFTPAPDGYVVGESVRSLVRFRRLNLLEEFPDYVQRVDAIFCQNVTIYFQAEARRQLMERFYACLPEGGLLFLGFSETLWNVFDGFRSREVAGAYVYYKARAEKPAAPARPRRLEKPAAPAAPPQPRRAIARAGTQPERPRHAPHSGDAAVIQEARELLDQGHTTAALDALRRVAPNSPSAPEALNLAARAHADRGDLELAAAEAIRVLEIDTLNDEAYLLLGIVYVRQGQWQLAAQQLERARYLRPEAALISYYLAEAYASLGQVEQARREYASALWKMRDAAPDALLDGVAVAWLRDTCGRQIERITRGGTP